MAVVQGWGVGVTSDVCQETSVFHRSAAVSGHTYLKHGCNGPCPAKALGWEILRPFPMPWFLHTTRLCARRLLSDGVGSQVPAHSTRAFYSVFLFKITAQCLLSPMLNRPVKLIPDKERF